MAWVALLILGMPKMVGLASRKTAVLPVFLFLSASVLVAQKEALDDHLQDKFERMVAALALELRVHDQAQVAQVFPKVDWALSVARYPADNHLSIFGIRPIKGSREGIESVYPARSDTRCSGSLDEVSAIAGENQYASVRGWFFDGKSNQSSTLLTIVDPQGLVVGYALTGAERPDVASLVDAKAGRSGFKGYVLKDRLGSALTLESADSGCHLEVKTTPIVYNYKVVEPALSEASVSINSIVDPQGWLGTDSWHSMIKGMTVVGSWRQSDADTGSITLRLKRVTSFYTDLARQADVSNYRLTTTLLRSIRCLYPLSGAFSIFQVRSFPTYLILRSLILEQGGASGLPSRSSSLTNNPFRQKLRATICRCG